jgi:hypothetical protein
MSTKEREDRRYHYYALGEDMKWHDLFICPDKNLVFREENPES